MNEEDFNKNIQSYLKEWNEFKDLALTHKKLRDLQTRWNSLREWLEDYIKLLYKPDSFEEQTLEDLKEVLDKMNELEGEEK